MNTEQHLLALQSRLNERLADFIQAVTQLARAVARPEDEFIRDSVIQRFEFTYELAWKMLKLRLELDGVMASTPRQVWQEALQAGFITDGNVWSELQGFRNQTSHTYDANLAQQVYRYVCDVALGLFEGLATQANQWKQGV